ncbi:hypothetical protein PHMEG_00013799 [Phytophthora megakarya]|uniref:Uncharacterized protein n=1 Tax=Phytophthora megakarya TaxID=4795 RepID=A0A225W7I6_9STRA|nr:hypothetical protein PHMEG_00013799 [Phytophthora megakarya]
MLNGGVFFEFHDYYALPFDIWRTATAVWDPEQDRSGKPILHFSLNFTTNSDTKMRMLGFAFCIKSVEYRVVMRSVTRRYFEDGRIVFISKNLIQPVIKGISFAFLATRRMILKSGDWSALGPTTVMQTHRDAAFYGNLTSMDRIENPIVKAGVEDWKNSLLLYNNKVEDQLIHAVNKAATPM